MPNAWPSVTATKVHLDNSADDPSQARAELASLVDKVNEIIAALAYASGVCDLDASTLIPQARLPATTGLNKYIAATGAANTYAISPSPAIASYVAGREFLVKISATNTGASTLNVNSLGAVAIKTRSGAALSAGQLVAGGLYHLMYDGTYFQADVLSATTGTATAGTPHTYFTSIPTTNTYYPQAHGLGAVPTFLVARYEATSSTLNGGYSTGDSIFFGDGGKEGEIAVSADATNVTVSIKGAASNLKQVIKDGTGTIDLTNASYNAKWKIVVTPYLVT